jgi:ankyrin repeat protein
LIQGGTALLDASYEGHDEVVRLLLMAGADVNVPQANVCIVSCSSTYSFCLQFTVGHMVGMLLWSCMNDACSTNFIHVPLQTGWTALHMSCAQGKISCAEILIAHGADTTIKCKVFPLTDVNLTIYSVFDVEYRTIRPRQSLLATRTTDFGWRFVDNRGHSRLSNTIVV